MKFQTQSHDLSSELPSKGNRDMGSKKFKTQTLIFNRDLDLESAWLSYGFCTLSH